MPYRSTDSLQRKSARELDHETRKFFAAERNLRVDQEKKEVYLSEILSFFKEDFTPAHAPSLIPYVNRYAREPVPDTLP